jgi:hypothetical protein
MMEVTIRKVSNGYVVQNVGEDVLRHEEEMVYTSLERALFDIEARFYDADMEQKEITIRENWGHV